MTSKVNKLQRASAKNPLKVEASQKYQTPKTLKQNYIFFPASDKDCYLTHILNLYAEKTSLVFVDTCAGAMRLAILLKTIGFSCTSLHANMTQEKRFHSLEKFKSRKCQVLVATDVASRGLDIPNVDLVINYDVPFTPKDYIHRVGRSARAGKNGQAITFLSQFDIEAFQKIEEATGQKQEAFPVDEADVKVLLGRVMEAERSTNLKLKEMKAEKIEKKRERLEEEGIRPKKKAKKHTHTNQTVVC
eukprot:c10135_g1_i1.p1 GENE.c10135_g1_i1~~c10135_g1_i1.p1  ORF type:complete len:246 (-),score=102.13 c10135_g1_i1:14-751(-)